MSSKKASQKNKKTAKKVSFFDQLTLFNSPVRDGFYKPFWISFGVVVLLMLFMSLSTGINGDDYFHHDYGEKLVNFYSSFGENKDALYVEKGKMHNYGGILDIPATLTRRMFGLEEGSLAHNNVRHIFNVLFGATAVLFTCLITSLVFGWRGALITLVIMFLSPRFMGHALMNPRDIPMAAGYAVGLYYLLRMLKEMPNVTWKTGLGFSLGLLIVCGIRIGGIVIIPYAILFTVITLFLKGGFSKVFSIKDLISHYKPLVIFTLIGVVLGVLFWPLGFSDPFTNIPKTLSTFSKFTTNIRLLFDGRMVWGQELTVFSYLSKWLIFTIPIAALLGFIMSLIFSVKIAKKHATLPLLLALFAFLFPIAFVIYKESTLYDGWRHLTFTYIGFAAAAGIGWSALFAFIEDKWTSKYIAPALLVLFSLQPLIFTATNYKHLYTYFNPIAGGMKGAFGHYEQDYWGVTGKEAMDWLKDNGHFDKGTKENPVVVGTNFYFNLKPYLGEYKDRVQIVYHRVRERFDKDFDYAIHVARFIDGTHLQSGTWPSKRAIHTIDANGVPLAAIYSNTDKNAVLGQKAYKAGQYQEAIGILEKEVVNFPNNNIAWNALADCYSRTNQTAKAENAYSQLMTLDRGNSQAIIGLASVKLAQGKKNEALNIVNKMIKENPKDGMGYYYLGVIELQSGNAVNALNYAQKALKLSPNLRQAYQLMAQAYEATGDKAAAQRIYKALQGQ